MSLKSQECLQTNDSIIALVSSEHLKSLSLKLKPKQAQCNRIMIAGGNPLSLAVASVLEKTYSLKIIEPDCTLCKKLATQLVSTPLICDNPGNPEVLSNENIESTDTFLSLMQKDELSIMIGMQAKYLGAKTVIVPIQNKHYTNFIKQGLH